MSGSKDFQVDVSRLEGGGLNPLAISFFKNLSGVIRPRAVMWASTWNTLSIQGYVR